MREPEFIGHTMAVQGEWDEVKSAMSHLVTAMGDEERVV